MKVVLYLLLIFGAVACPDITASLTVASGVFDASDPVRYGIDDIPAEHIRIYSANEGGWKFAHEVSLAYARGNYYAVWSAAARDELGPDQVVVISSSPDGRSWTPPKPIVEDHDGASGQSRWISSGIEADEDGKLVVYVTSLRGQTVATRGWITPILMRVKSEDGVKWSAPETILNNCLSFSAPKKLRSGTKLISGEDSTGRPLVLRQLKTAKEWSVHYIPLQESQKVMEGSILEDTEGRLKIIFRDEQGGLRLMVSESADEGITWSTPVQTNYPDSRSKAFTMSSILGGSYVINNANHVMWKRNPLMVGYTENSTIFNSVRIVRDLRGGPIFQGNHKGPGPQYPEAIEANGDLSICYDVNKEDVWVSHIRLNEFLSPKEREADPIGPVTRFTVEGRTVLSAPDIVGSDLSYEWFYPGVPNAIGNKAWIELKPEQTADGLTLIIRRDGLRTIKSSSESQGEVGNAIVLNLSCRADLKTGDATTVGVVVEGNSDIAVTAIGPALKKYGIVDPASDPSLEVFHAGAIISKNDDWNAIGWIKDVSSLIPADGSKDAIAEVKNFSGPLTALVREENIDGANGSISLLEIYVRNLGRAKILNGSIRGHTGTGHSTLILGFVAGGEGKARYLIRTLSDTLEQFGIQKRGKLSSVAIVTPDGRIVQRWPRGFRSNLADFEGNRCGAIPQIDGSEEVAIVTVLEPGAYTVLYEIEAGSEGVGMIEIYTVKQSK